MRHGGNIANKISNKLTKAQENLVKQQSKLDRNIQNRASQRVIQNRMKKLNGTEKEVLKLSGQLAAVKTASKTAESAASTANKKTQGQ